MRKKVISFRRGVPPAESFPNDDLIACTKQVIKKHSAEILQYGSAAGYEPLREIIAKEHQVDAGLVMVGQGSLQLLDILCRVTLSGGEAICVEQPTYDRTLTIFKRSKAELKGFVLDHGQMNMNEVESVIKSEAKPKYFYVIPDFQNPSGAVMGMEERQALTSMAKKYGFKIIEDNPYRKLRYEGSALPTLFEMSPGEVIHMSSYSKQISPGMRIGYMILPKDMAGEVIQFAEDTYVCPSFFGQAVVAEFIERGMLEKNLQDLTRLYHPRLRTILDAMETRLEEYGKWIRPQGGFYVGLTLDEKINMDRFHKSASAGLALTSGKGFYINGGSHFIRLPFCPLSEEENAEGIRRIADAAKASL